MSQSSKKSEYISNKLESMILGFFVFMGGSYKKIYRFIAKKRAQRRVQKMLKNNFVGVESKKDKKTISILHQFPTLGLTKTWRSVAAVFSVTFLVLVIITSQYYGFKITEAEILAQNFTQDELVVAEGIELLKYDTRSVSAIDEKVEFDAGAYTNGNFEAGEDDLVAVVDTDDYLELGHYGDNLPDTSVTDWWDDNNYKTCSASEFNNGTYSDTQLDVANDWVELDATGLANGTGMYTSEIFDAGDDISWNTLSWETTHPTLKDLPDNKQAEFGYDDGNSDMQKNELLMHFEESSGNVADSSGNGFTGTVGATTTYGAIGRFNDALDFSGGSQGEVTIDDSSHPLNYVDKVSYGAWFKADTFRNWAGVMSRMSTWPSYGGGGYNLQVGTAQRIACGSGVYTNSDSMPVTGEWYHAVCVYDGTQMRLYVNGVLQNDVDTITLTKSTTDEINIGEFYTNGSSLDFDGQIDEVFISHEELSATDVLEMYQRGAHRTKFQVRSCDDNACSGETFVGPDGTASTYYTEELNNGLALPSVVLSGIADNRYFQYQAILESDIIDTSPELKCVNINMADRYNWKYRKCFNIDNTGANSTNETEYQIYLDMDTETLVTANKMLADGSDMRFVDSNENVLSYFIADDMNTTSTRVWLQMDNIDAASTEEVCMYYGNSGANAMSSRSDVFTYNTQEEIYHVVADTAETTVTEFASYTNNNDVSVSTYSSTLNQYDNDIFPSGAGPVFTQTTGISTTHPISGTYNVNGADNLVPASFASENFVYRMDRYTNYFSFISPWCSADVEVRNQNNNIVTNGSFTIAQGTHHNLTTDNNAVTGLANDDTVMIEVTNGCPILAQHHSDTGGDSFVMAPAAEEWYGVGSGHFGFAALYDNTNITVYRSNGTSVSYTLNRGENIDINDAGSEGSDPAHRVVADNLIGVSALADSDGGEATTFLPVNEMGYKYYFPEGIQYIAIATKENTTTTVDLYYDGTQCGVGAPDDTATVTAAPTYPGKVYFGSTTDGMNIPEGACIVADNPVFAYDENAAENDEHNAWNEVQNKQFISPAPSYTVGSEEIGTWDIDGTNTWIRRVPITVNNTSTVNLTDYQINIDLENDVNVIFGKTQDDGGDIRVAGSAGDGTDNIVYSLENFDGLTTVGNVWVKVPSISASSSTTIYIYYNIGIDINDYNPLLWLDAADSSTITQSAGSVSQWDDKSVNGNNVTQGTASSQPQVITDGSHQVLEFSSDYMTDADGIWGNVAHSDTYVFAVYKNLNLPENGALFYENVVGGRYAAWSPWSTTLYYQPATASYLTATYNGDTTNYHVLKYESHSSGARDMARDGTSMANDANGATFTGNNSNFNVCAYPDGSNPQSVNMAEMIVIDSALTSAQVSEIEDYLTQKWISGPASVLTTTSDHFAVFQTTNPKVNYYIVDERAIGETLSIISFDNGNQVSDTVTTQTVDEGEIVTLPFGAGVAQIDSYSVTGPLHIGFDGDSTDAAIPIAYAGREFTYRVDRGSDVFSFYAPFADASVQIQESSGAGWTTLQTVVVATGTVQTVAQNIVNSRVFKIISDEPILGFHHASNNDSKILYPTHLAFEEGSGSYEIYGIGTGSVLLGASSDANVTIYRSDGTSVSVVLNAANNFSYKESGGGSQGTALGYHIVSDAPIGATSYADADGIETVVFLSQKEFSREYVVSNPTQYISVVARDANVTCRVYDDTGAEITTDATGTMNNIPPQTGGGQVMPYPNNIHIGGADTSDGAYFQAGYHMICDEPVYAYYEHHLNSTISDETSWLTWPQVRKRAEVEPIVEDVDNVDEQGLYYESGFDSAGVGTDFEAYAEYTFDTSAMIYGEHTYWREITWEEIINSRSSMSSVEQITIEVASADPVPTCATATYGAYAAIAPTTLSTVDDTSLPYVTNTTNTKQIILPDYFSDHSCVKMRVYLRTGDQAYAPKINNVKIGHYIPTILGDQLSNPTVSVAGATTGTSERYRVVKAVTADAGLNGSQVFITYEGSSNESVFTQADLDLFEIPTQTTNPQFTFPPFPGSTPVDAATNSPFDSSNDLAVYFTNERTAGVLETMDFIFNVDINSIGGPQISRDFELEISGL